MSSMVLKKILFLSMPVGRGTPFKPLWTLQGNVNLVTVVGSNEQRWGSLYWMG